MTKIRKLAAVACALAAISLLPAAPPAMADHDTPPPPPPPHGPAPSSLEAPDWQSGFYYVLDFDIGGSENPITDADFSVDLDWGMGVGFGAGYRLGMLRLEAEYYGKYYYAGSLDLGPTAPFPLRDYNGGNWTQTGMANVYFDMPAAGRMRPYLGAGYGISRVSAKYNESWCFILCFATSNKVVSDWDIAESWQAMAGVSFADRTEKSEFFVGYRYFATADLEFRTIAGTPFVQEGLKSHTLSLGMRFLM